jgi:hypothetical protein
LQFFVVPATFAAENNDNLERNIQPDFFANHSSGKNSLGLSIFSAYLEADV